MKLNVIALLSILILGISSCNRQSVQADKKEVQDNTYKPYIKIIEQQGAKAELDLTTQVLSLDLPVIETVRNTDEFIYPSLDKIESDIKFIPTSMVIAKLKQFEDGLYAAVELKLQEGSDNFIGKKSLLKEIKNILDTNKELYKYEIEFVENAIRLGQGEDVDLKELEKKYKFLENHLKPIGFYTWNEEFERIFRQDRLLQAELETNSVKNFQTVFLNSDIKNNYTKYTDFIQKLTNPFPQNNFNLIKQDPEFKENDKYFFFPKCRSHETELFKRRFSPQFPPDEYSIMDDLIESIRNGEVSLIPDSNSGWYDMKTYSLEPFLFPDSMPEAKNLNFSEKYKKELVELFKGALALTRETHVKNIDVTTSVRSVDMLKTIFLYASPDLKYEPTMTFYKRSAEVYTFVRKVLGSMFSESELKNMKRFSTSGNIQMSLYEELQYIENLLYGIYYLTAHTIGTEIKYEHEIGQVEDLKSLALEWANNIKADQDVGTDNRMMVPVYYNAAKEKYKVWMFIGYTKKPLSVTYNKKPEFTLFAPDDQTQVILKFKNQTCDLYTPVFEEMLVDSLLNRTEFREICDKLKTRYNIKKYFGESKFEDDKYKEKLTELGLSEKNIYNGELSGISFKDSVLNLGIGNHPILKIDESNGLFRKYEKEDELTVTHDYIYYRYNNNGKLIKGTYKPDDYLVLGKVKIDGTKEKYYLGSIKFIRRGEISFELVKNYKTLKYNTYLGKLEIVE